MMILGTVALAAPDQQVAGNPTAQEGTITIHPSSTVPIGNKTLYAYRILDASYISTGSLTVDPPTQGVAYTIPAGMQSFYESYFDQDANPSVEAKTLATLAAEAHKTVDDYVADQIHGMTTADLKKFEYEALAAAKVNNAAVKKSGAKNNDGDYVFSALEAGYYVIEDEGADKPISVLMLDTVTNANVEINLKAEDNTEKIIIPAGELINQKADELGLGRPVDYKITQKIPDPTGYTKYYYIINDKLDTGLTFNPDSVVVKVGTKTLTKDTDYKLYYDNGAKSDEAGYDANIATILDGKTFRIAFIDLIGHIANPSTFTNNYSINDAVEVTYNATVNSNAITGVAPNKNTVTVQYSENPSKSEGPDKNGYPGIPDDTTNHPLGEGPEKITDTFTTKITILKQDGSNNNAALPGVEFTLTSTNAKDVNFGATEVYDIDATGEYWLLKNGKYTTTAPQTKAAVSETTGPAGWVEIDATAAATAIAGDIPVRIVDQKYYRPYVEATDSALPRYTIVEPNSSDYADTTTKYKKTVVSGTDATQVAYDVMRAGITGDDGKLSFAQLGAGTYTLAETGVLAGFNDIPDITFTISCTLPEWKENENPLTLKNFTGAEKATWAITVPQGANYSFTEEKSGSDGLGTFVITLQNNKGVELPSTGGMGTTIFYVAGSIMVLAAAILLITKRRMGAND